MKWSYVLALAVGVLVIMGSYVRTEMKDREDRKDTVRNVEVKSEDKKKEEDSGNEGVKGRDYDTVTTKISVNVTDG